MPKHLYTIPSGTTLPSTAGLADGYPFLLSDGLIRVLYENFAGVWHPTVGVRHVVSKSASYTLVLTDAGHVVEMTSSSATTLTVPDNATVAFPIGTTIGLANLGSGTETVAAAGGVTIHSLSGHLALSGQYATASLRKQATDTWLLEGSLA